MLRITPLADDAISARARRYSCRVDQNLAIRLSNKCRCTSVDLHLSTYHGALALKSQPLLHILTDLHLQTELNGARDMGVAVLGELSSSRNWRTQDRTYLWTTNVCP